MSVSWCSECAEYVDDDDTYAPNGALIKRDCGGYWRDVSGAPGYTVRLSGTWYCYTCGVLCECFEDEGE